MTFFERNFEVLNSRFPDLANRIDKNLSDRIGTASAGDGGICYAVKNEAGQWIPLSNPVNPAECAGNALNKMKSRLLNGLSPAVVVGLYPGYELDFIFNHFKSRLKFNEPFRHIYVIADSILCLAAWLKAADRTEILQHPEVLFYWHENVDDIVTLCESDYRHSHLFIPVSTLPESEMNRIIEPLARLYIKRQQEEIILANKNNEYYDSLTDEKLADALSGNCGRKPRLLMPAHMSSTVVQYSTRDTCTAFEKHGWETKILKMERDISPWLIMKTINEFKPDLFIFINHLRTEDGKDCRMYPDNMMFLTWIQDNVLLLNNKAAADMWNRTARAINPQTGKMRHRDFLVGYTDIIRPFGYAEELMKQIPMIVNPEIFHPRKLTEEQMEKYGCDICFASNKGKTTEEVVENELFPYLAAFGFSRQTADEIHDMLWKIYRKGRTITSYDQLAELLCTEIPSFRKTYDEIQSKDTAANITEKIFWTLNDHIYRHIVLEWCDGLGLKLNLYGKDWERHPRFKKYAKGVIKHGEELSIAYQAAKYCLHLNAIEGTHQRINEIIASGAFIISRGIPPQNTKLMDIVPVLDKIERVNKKRSGHCSGGLQSILTDKELGALYGAVTEIALPSGDKAQSLDALRSECGRLLHECLFFNRDRYILREKQSFFDTPSELSKMVRSSPGIHAKDLVSGDFDYGFQMETIIDSIKTLLGVSASGGVLDDYHADFDPLLRFIMAAAKPEIFESEFRIFKESCKSSLLPDIIFRMIEFLLHKRNDIKYLSNTLSVSDVISNKSLPDWKALPVKTAILLSKGLKPGEILHMLDGEINEIYERTPSGLNLLAPAVWDFFIPVRSDYKGVLPFLIYESDKGKLSHEWEINKAVALAGAGNFNAAVETIRDIYSGNPYAKDGYSKAAWTAFVDYKEWRDKTVEWFEKDFSLGRLSETNINLYVTSLVACGSLEKACSIIENAYSMYPSLNDSFSNMALHCIMFSRLSKEKLEYSIALHRKDIALGRASNPMYVLFFDICSGKWEKVFRHVAGQAENLCGMMAWAAMCYSPVPVPDEQLLSMFRHNHKGGCVSPEMMLFEAGLLARLGDKKQALELVDHAYGLNALLVNGRSRVALGLLSKGAVVDEISHLFMDDYKAGRMNSAMKLIFGTIIAQKDPGVAFSLKSEAFSETGIAQNIAYTYCYAFVPDMIPMLDEFCSNDGTDGRTARKSGAE